MGCCRDLVEIITDVLLRSAACRQANQHISRIFQDGKYRERLQKASMLTMIVPSGAKPRKGPVNALPIPSGSGGRDGTRSGAIDSETKDGIKCL